jgi:protein SCO1/2
MTEIVHQYQAEPQATDGRATGAMLPFVLSGAILVAMVYGGWKWWQVRQFEAARSMGTPVVVSPLPLSDFELEERGGQSFRSAEMRGKVWVASYFFASCIGPCRILNGNIQELTSQPDLADVTWVSITCDPDNDTVEVLKQYANQYHADPKRWLFCRADLDYLKRVARGMNLALFMKQHSDHLVVVDRAGTIRGMFDGTSTYQCQQLRTLLHECLAEAPPQAGIEVKQLDETISPPAAAASTSVDPALECHDDEPTQPANRSGT